jgi:hypothetical protein
LILKKNKFNIIFIVESRALWSSSRADYNIENDLVLTFDFALKKEIEAMHGHSFYIDCICEPIEMQKNNFLAATFFKNWHYDVNGNDIFTYQNTPIGFSFRIHIWSEFLYLVRLAGNLVKLKEIKYEKIVVIEKGCAINDTLNFLGLNNIFVEQIIINKKATYFFDIHLYMKNSLNRKNKKILSKKSLLIFFTGFLYKIKKIFFDSKKTKNIFCQVYHPSIDIVEKLLKDKNLNIFTQPLFYKRIKFWFEYSNVIPESVSNNRIDLNNIADSLINDFKLKKIQKLILHDRTDITELCYKEIINNVTNILPQAIQHVVNINYFLDKNRFDLEIMIANLGLFETILDFCLKNRNVSNYMIINGLLMGEFCDEAKYASHINSYSQSIKKYYFEDKDNVVCLGDPRMDKYINNQPTKIKSINRDFPTITIGTSGFNNLDLISYTAIEFEFMFDILNTFNNLNEIGYKFNLIIKVRPNGFLSQYVAFASEYFPDLKINIIQNGKIKDVLESTDLYISIYSQTIFEASCLGIPVIYYKKDKEFLDPPFDNKSELVTASNVEELKYIYLEFLNNSDIFTPFLDKKVMEKYIGPLDGKNLERNLSFIYKLIEN